MKKVLLTILFFTSLAANAQTSCLRTYCKDTVYLPLNTIPLIAYLSTTAPVIQRGWTFIGGPAVIVPPAGDSVNVTFPVAGNYVFQYSYKTSTGIYQAAYDSVAVIATLVPVAKKIIVNTYDQFGKIINTSTINL